MAEVLSVPRSIAEIYGLLYISPAPLRFAEIEKRLSLSKGSVSEGLRFLKDHGMARAERAKGSRAETWSVTPSLAAALTDLLRRRLQPALEHTTGELASLQAEAVAASLPPEVIERVGKLNRWNTRALELLPLLLARPSS
jgi:DNA-binding transcriptional regulator GbsR (MarR family)